MRNSLPSHFIGKLFSFMLLFGISHFEIAEVRGEVIRARVMWSEDEIIWGEVEPQEVEWDVPDDKYLDDAIKIVEFLIDNKLMDGDKITVDPDNLCLLMDWKKSKFDAALNSLLSMRVEMVDDGVRTDFYFVHF